MISQWIKVEGKNDITRIPYDIPYMWWEKKSMVSIGFRFRCSPENQSNDYIMGTWLGLLAFWRDPAMRNLDAAQLLRASWRIWFTSSGSCVTNLCRKPNWNQIPRFFLELQDFGWFHSKIRPWLDHGWSDRTSRCGFLAGTSCHGSGDWSRGGWQRYAEAPPTQPTPAGMGGSIVGFHPEQGFFLGICPEYDLFLC